MAHSYTVKPAYGADRGVSGTDRGDIQQMQRNEAPRESMKHIKLNQVKRTTAMFEPSESPQVADTPIAGPPPNPHYPYKPKEKPEDTRVSTAAMPNYPYRPRASSQPVAMGNKQAGGPLSSRDYKTKNVSSRDSEIIKYPTRDSKLPLHLVKVLPAKIADDKPKYPYSSSSPKIQDEKEDQPKYPYRPHNLDVTKPPKPGRVPNSGEKARPISVQNPQKPVLPYKTHDDKTSAADKRVSAMIANKTKMFEQGTQEKTDSASSKITSKAKLFEQTCAEGTDKPMLSHKPMVKLKAPVEANEDEDDITPTNEPHTHKHLLHNTTKHHISTPVPDMPPYAKVNKSGKIKNRIEKLQKQLSTDETQMVETAAGTQVLPPGKPPRKPPRTFAHDDYVRVKLESQPKKSNEAFVEHDQTEQSNSNPFYEEVRQNGTIRRKPAKVLRDKDKMKTYESIHDDSGTGVYQNFKSKVATYEKVEDISSMALSPASKPEPPPRPRNLTHMDIPASKSHDRRSHDKHLSPTNQYSRSPIESDDQYHDQAMVQVRKTSREGERKISPVIIGRGIANPGYLQKNDVIPIKVVSMKDGSLKRYKSDEFLYADPEALSFPNSYVDPVDTKRITLKGRQPALRRNVHGVDIDHEGYAMPCNAVNRQHSRELMKEQLSEAYSVLRRKPPMTKRSSNDRAGTSTDDDDSDTEVDLNEHRKKIEYVTAMKDRRLSVKQSSIYASAMLPRQKGSNQLYSYAMIVGLEATEEANIYTPNVKFSFPHQDTPLTVIASFCFPDAANWRPVSNYTSESYSFVLTGATGERQYGYCRRFLPPSKNNRDRLPEVYCIISSLQSWNFYNRLLEELEKKRAISLDNAQELLQAAYGRPLPAPGKEAWIRTTRGLSATVKNQDCVCLRRPSDKRLEKVSFAELMKHVSVDTLMIIFASFLLERRLIFVARHLGMLIPAHTLSAAAVYVLMDRQIRHLTLTKCVHALISLLYPFSWPHTFIPILPLGLLEVVESPTPFIVGVLTSSAQLVMSMELEEVLIVDIDNDKVLRSIGDESRIIPKKLQKALTTALKAKSDSNAKQTTKPDTLVPEAFMRMFIETIGHYTEFIQIQQNGEQVFQKEGFVRAVSSKSIRLFLEWFVETQLFEAFIQEKMEAPCNEEGLFEIRLFEYREEMERYSPTFKQNVKEAGKKLRNFFVESGEKLKKAFRPNNVYV